MLGLLGSEKVRMAKKTKKRSATSVSQRNVRQEAVSSGPDRSEDKRIVRSRRKAKADERFVRLTDTQVDFFSKVSDNKNILVSGYAGTGKTVIAKAAAQKKIIEGKTVLFLCYNRTLASKIRFSFDKNNELTFHC